MQKLKLSKAFDQTLKDFGITAKWLSEQSGVSEKLISLFRNDRQRVYSDSLEKLLEALPAEARRYFFELVCGYGVYSCRAEKSILDLVEDMNPIELAELLNAVADKLTRRKVAI